MDLHPGHKSSAKPSAGLTLTLGISSCLYGAEVRFDGGHKKDDLILETIGRFVKWVPVCPEVEMGLGVPRETLRLEGESNAPRLVQTDSRRDVTDQMKEWAKDRLKTLARENIDGYVTKRGSPSCGLYNVKLYDANNSLSEISRGIFADELVKAFPLLPVEEEERLNDPIVRDHFIERVFAYHRLKGS